MAWELQFASFQLSPMVFLAAVWALGARRWGETSKEHRDFVYMMLGLLGFALVACLVRTGAYALRLDAPLYGLPVMLVAIACVHTARRLVADEPDTPAPRLASIRRLRTFGSGFRAGSGQPAGRFAGLLCEYIGGVHRGVRSLCRLAAHRSPPGVSLSGLRRRRRRAPGCPLLFGRAPARDRRGGPATARLSPSPADPVPGHPGRDPLAWLSPACHCGSSSIGTTGGWRGTVIISAFRLSIAACVWSGFEPLAAVICLSALRDLVPAGGLDLRRPVGDVPGGGRAGRRLLFRDDAGTGHHAGRSGPGGGRAWLCLLGRTRRTAQRGMRHPLITFPGSRPHWP